MRSAKKFLALLLAALMCMALVPAAAVTDDANDTLRVAVGSMTGKFSPFFYSTSDDQRVADMTQIKLINCDRQGMPILKGISGETTRFNGTDYTYYGPAEITVTQNSNGSVYYDVTLRSGITFADGTPMTIDDVIFSMYVLADPSYDGPSLFKSLPIEGMWDYRLSMESRVNLILETEHHGYTQNPYYTEADYQIFFAAFDVAGAAFAQSIVDYVCENYLTDYYVQAYFNEDLTAEEVASDPVLMNRFACAMWGYDQCDTPEAFWAQIFAVYGYNLNGINIECTTAEFEEFLYEALGDRADYFWQYINIGAPVNSISGIRRTGDYSMRIVMTDQYPGSIYDLRINIAPLHYYGQRSLYNYANNQFGFIKGDLSRVRSMNGAPLGSGPYKFVEYSDGTVYFERNTGYYRGCPKTKRVSFVVGSYFDGLEDILNGRTDICSNPSFSFGMITEIEETNSNGLLTGDVITTVKYDNDGYGYIGINADRVKIGSNPASEESKNLRKGYMTVLAVYRDAVIDAYYGELAEIIQYPIPNCSWAAPRPGDQGYRDAFSVDVNGNPIYSAGMTQEQRYEAAKQAAIGYFRAAGYIYNASTGRFTIAPDPVEITIPGNGYGDQPCYDIAVNASEALESIGITLTINDVSNSNLLWNGLDNRSLDMWAAAWGSQQDPDMYQVYHSSNSGGNGTQSNYFQIRDAQLDALIMQARETADFAARKALYKQCLDIIMDWGVEAPVYDRQNAYLFSTERVKMQSVAPDLTVYCDWMAEIEKIELNGASGPDTPGDVNNDGTITGNDALLVLRYTLGIISSIDTEAADVDGNGVVNANDALMILRAALGLIQL